MTRPELMMAGLEARDLAVDRAALENRLESYRHLQPTRDPILIVPTNAESPSQIEHIVPELSAEEFTADRLKSAVAEHGAVIVRDMFPKAAIQSMTHTIDQVLDACASPRKVRANLVSPYFNPPGNIVSIMPEGAEELGALRLFSSVGGSSLCVEATSVAEMLLEFYERYGLKEVITEYLGEPPVLSVKKWVLRRSELPMAEAGWHQDGAFMGTDINTINMWIPLSQCGGETGAPGMDVIPKRLNKIASAEGATFDWSVSDEQANRNFGGASPVAPVFNEGDVFFFDHFYLHRTQFRTDFTKLRYAIETWFFGSTHFPKNQVPIAW
jgi:hypothetical protein